MVFWIGLALCIAALVVLFVRQWERSQENAEETAELRSSGVTWDDWFEP